MASKFLPLEDHDDDLILVFGRTHDVAFETWMETLAMHIDEFRALNNYGLPAQSAL